MTKGRPFWSYETGNHMVPIAGPGTVVAGVRSGTVLYAGEEPDGLKDSTWDLVPGAIDAQLTFDGDYVLYWSSRLEPTHPGGHAVMLEQGPVKGNGFWTIDTDGTVLVAAPDQRGTWSMTARSPREPASGSARWTPRAATPCSSATTCEKLPGPLTDRRPDR